MHATNRLGFLRSLAIAFEHRIRNSRCEQIQFRRITRRFLSTSLHMRASNLLDERFAVAPMLDVTDNHFRHLCRLISRRAVLYTEMIVDNTLIYNADKPDLMQKFLGYHDEQHPIVLQLGGYDPSKLAHAASIASEFKYDAINLNCGCPSPRVAGKGCFGASLMFDALNVAECCRRMSEALGGSVPVTVKCRIGVDRADDTFDFVRDFVQTVRDEGGVHQFSIHARAAWLDGLSPAQNRNIPPLKYEYVYRLAEEFQDCRFILNGGITSLEAAKTALENNISGVMLGRAVRDNTWEVLNLVDSEIYNESNDTCDQKSRETIVMEYAEYAHQVMQEDSRLSGHHLLRPVVEMFHGAPRGKVYRKRIDEGVKAKDPIREILRRALDEVPEDVRLLLPSEFRERMLQRSPSGSALESEQNIAAVRQ